MDIRQIIENLSEEFYKGKSFLWGKKALVNLQKCEELIEELRKKLPTSISEANYVLTKRDKIIENAKTQADEILCKARAEAALMISNSTIVKESKAHAINVIEKAGKEAQFIEVNSKENIDKMLKSIEDYLIQNLNIVKSNREELAHMILNARRGDIKKDIKSDD